MFALKKAFVEFQSQHPDWGLEPVEEVRDGKGVYAFYVFSKKYGKYGFFCSKASMGGDQVSVHLSLFERAWHKNQSIIMGLIDDKKVRFYVFKPQEIVEKENFVNVREGALMINFSIKTGHSLQPKLPLHPVHKKLVEEFDAIPVTNPQ